MPWGSPLVVDLSFFLDAQNKDLMTRKVVGRIYKSLNKAIRMNRTSAVPSALHLTNFDRDTFQELSFMDDVSFGESTRQVRCLLRAHSNRVFQSSIAYRYFSDGCSVYVPESPGSVP